jgi:hypothetical protein
MKDAPASMNPPLGVGLHVISDAKYHADPCAEPSLSCSLGKQFIDKSCRHAFYSHPRLGGQVRPRKEPTPAMDFGSAIHAMLLAGGNGLAIGDFNTWQSNDSKVFKAAARNSGMIPILRKTHEEAKEVCAGFHDEMQRLGLDKQFAASKKEVTAIWQDGPTWLRAKLDTLLIDEISQTAQIFDLKVTAAANPSKWEGQIGSMNYDLQSAMYPAGIVALRPELAGRTTFTFLVIEDDFPYSVTPVELNGEFAALGAMKYKRVRETWALCRSTGEWPGYTAGVFRASPKPWDVTREAEATMPEFGKE